MLGSVAAAAVVGVGVATIGIPAAIGALGFTGAGILGGSVAAGMMSSAAVANGGGVAAGSLVAILQSYGAAGIPLAIQGAVTAGITLLGALFP